MEYSIGDLSKITRVSGKTLHRYHHEGLVVPSRIDKFTSRRYYDEKSFHRVEVVRRFHQLGIASNLIKEALSKHKDTRHYFDHIRRNEKEANHFCGKLGITGEALRTFLDTQVFDRIKVGKLEEKKLDDIFAATIRFKENPDIIPDNLEKLISSTNSAANGNPFILFHDDHRFEDETELECCLPVQRKVPAAGIRFETIKGTRAVCVLYEGPYDSIWMGYRVIIDYLNQHNLAIQSPSREIWLDIDPVENNKPGLLRKIEIQFLTGDPNDPDFKRDITRPGYGIDAAFDL